MSKVAVAFLWHQHQPYYPDDVAHENPMPWVRLHGVKDYYGMALHLFEYPAMRCTINLVPSLLVQLQAYTEGKTTDKPFQAARRPAEDLTEEERLYLLDAWREAPFYSDRERAALAWTEAVTKVTEGHVPDAVFKEVREQFNDKELADLTMAIAAINAWNRMAISFRALPGDYQPGQFNHLLERQAH